MTDGEADPFNEELHGLRLYGWVEAYLEKRGWSKTAPWYSNPKFDEFGEHVSLGYAFEIQLRDDGLDLDLGAGEWSGGTHP